MFLAFAGSFVLAAMIVLGIGVLLPVDVETGQRSVDLRDVQQAERPQDKKQPLAEKAFRFVWRKKLMRPLADPAPPPEEKAAADTAPAPPPPPPFNGQLVGVLFDSEPGQSRAWVRLAEKRTELLSEGETLDDLPGKPTLEAIDRDSVLIRVGERAVVLKLGSDHAVEESGVK